MLKEDTELKKILTSLREKPPKTEELNEWVEQVITCMKEIGLITIFDTETGNLESAILNAFFQVQKSGWAKGLAELRLALAWNRFDMAKERIFDTKDLELSLQDFAKLLPFALVHNRVDFVREFISKGVKPKKCITNADLLFLYNSVVIF